MHWRGIKPLCTQTFRIFQLFHGWVYHTPPMLPLFYTPCYFRWLLALNSVGSKERQVGKIRLSLTVGNSSNPRLHSTVIAGYQILLALHSILIILLRAKKSHLRTRKQEKQTDHRNASEETK